MLKEIPKKIVDFNLEIGPLTTSESVTMKFLSLQDTTAGTFSKAQLPQSEVKKLETPSKNTGFISKSDSAKKLTSIVVSKTNLAATTPSDETSSTKIESKTFPFKPGYSAQTYQYNFLLDIPHKTISQEFNERIGITKSTHTTPVKENKSPVTTAVVVQNTPTSFQGNVRANASLDWLPGLLLVSLFTFSWIKMIYQKYVVQVVTSLVNYQVSIRLLREKNVLFRNMSIGLNFVFALNIGLFIFFYIQCYSLNQINSNNFLSTLIYCTGIIVLYNLKTTVCKLLGNLFLVKEQFAEYVHNIHLYNKNIGLFLFPIVIAYPYITNNQIKPIIINIGLAIVIGMSLLLIYRGFQIIMRSGVSIFYLILYLCAVEILPVLLLVKYSYTLI